MPGLSRICHPLPAILYAEPPRNRRAEPSRSFRVGFDPRIFSFPAHTLISISPLTSASFPPVPASSGFTPVFVLHPYIRIGSCFRFSPNPAPLLPALLLFSSFSLIPHSLLFPIFPQSCSASSGFTPVFVLYPYTRIRSYFRFFPNPAPLLPALLLFSSFILIPAFVLISDFPPIPLRFFRLYSCFCPSLYPHSLLFPIFPQSCPVSSGFTPASVLHPYTLICSY